MPTLKNGLEKFNTLMQRLQKSILASHHGKKLRKPYFRDQHEEVRVREEVKEGHFSVIAANGEDPKRFVVPLNYLSHPTFVRLLDQAAEEYGFGREGALEIPCWPVELESLLAEQWQCCC